MPGRRFAPTQSRPLKHNTNFSNAGCNPSQAVREEVELKYIVPVFVPEEDYAEVRERRLHLSDED
jgi:hypothetical protein